MSEQLELNGTRLKVALGAAARFNAMPRGKRELVLAYLARCAKEGKDMTDQAKSDGFHALAANHEMVREAFDAAFYIVSALTESSEVKP